MAVESVREEVEKISTEIFLKIRSKEEFKSLEINENFGLSIITENGSILDKSEWRSAGEEQIVALSLIGALNKCAHINAPLFMDTPFFDMDLYLYKSRNAIFCQNIGDRPIQTGRQVPFSWVELFIILG